MYGAIMVELSQKYTARREAESERISRAYALAKENAEISKLFEEKSTLEIEIIKKNASGEDTSDIQKNLEKVSLSLSQALKSKNIDINRRYVCDKCRDTGFSGGKLCQCAVKEYLKILKERSGISAVPSFTFAQNKIQDIDCAQQSILQYLYSTMDKFCDKFPDNKVKSIILSGTVGSGKSCLLSAVADKLLKRGFFVLYLTAFELNDMFLEYHLARIDDKNEIFRPLVEADLLVIDDLGVEPMRKDVTTNYLYKVVSERISKDKAVMITTNLDKTMFANRYSERTFSRLTEKGKSLFGEMGGDDLRRK